jgi:hypothetical protein
MNISLTKVLKNYGKTSMEELQNLSKKIGILQVKKSAVNQYYEINMIAKEKLMNAPRSVSFNFDLDPDLKNEEIYFLIKSTSRFFIKADFGEVVDQMTQKQKRSIQYLCVDLDYHQQVNESNGEYFIGRAWIFS